MEALHYSRLLHDVQHAYILHGIEQYQRLPLTAVSAAHIAYGYTKMATPSLENLNVIGQLFIDATCSFI